MSLSEKMVWVVEKVRERLLRSSAALERAAVPYAVTGDDAVAAWVAKSMNRRFATPSTWTS